MKEVIVISAHLDDAILSAGQFIAGRNGNVDALTVFSGIPMEKDLLTDYDKSCGFNSSKDAMVVRRQEDIEACAILNAKPIHLDILDSQYEKVKENALLDILSQLKIMDYEMIIGPLGLIHEDHIAVSNALLSLGLNNLYLYEDLPHRVTHPELVYRRLEELGFRITLAEIRENDDLDEPVFIGDGPIADKVRALWCYRSQMGRGDLNPYNLYIPERFWHVS